jgi:hypothetical protein
MNNDSPQFDQLQELCIAVREGDASSETIEQLENLLLETPGMRRYYVELMLMNAIMEWRESSHETAPTEVALPTTIATTELSDSLSDPISPISVSPGVGFLENTMHGVAGFFSNDMPFAYLVTTVLFGLVLLLGSFVEVSNYRELVASATKEQFPEKFVTNSLSPKDSSRTMLPDQATLPRQIAGRVTGVYDCHLADVNAKAVFGQSVAVGQNFTLVSGLMEITYDTGARVIVQGPATYQVDSPRGGFLSVGKLTARVEKKAAGGRKSNPQSPTSNPSPLFAVRTPTAIVTDLGTEFGVEVTDGGRVETYVLQGSVNVARVGDKNQTAGAPHTLHQGDAVCLVPEDKAIHTIEAKPRHFVRSLPYNGVAQDNFDTLHDYLKTGVAGTIWSGILNADKALQIGTQSTEVNGKQTVGQLVIRLPQGANVGWSRSERGQTFKTGPFLYVDVLPGDFEARVEVPAMTQANWSALGLMARKDDNNFISINRHNFKGLDKVVSFDARSEKDGVDIDGWRDDGEYKGRFALRLVRMDDAFMASFSVDGGEVWTPMNWGRDGGSVCHRKDMQGSLQIGIWYGTFSESPGTAAFDNFMLRANFKGD